MAKNLKYKNISAQKVYFKGNECKKVYMKGKEVFAGVANGYWGTATSLSESRYSLAATTVGNYALFGGGYDSSASNVVDAYDTSLTRSTATALSKSRSGLAATTVGNYALFGGGYESSSRSSVVDVYEYE